MWWNSTSSRFAEAIRQPAVRSKANFAFRRNKTNLSFRPERSEVEEPAVRRQRPTPAYNPAPPKAKSSLRLHQKFPLAHNLLVVHPNIKLPSHHINMRSRIP